MKKFTSLTAVAMEIVKIHFFNNQWKMLQEEKYLIKMNLTDAKYDWKNCVDWILDTWWDKALQPQNKKFKKKNYISWRPWTMCLLK